ncbi:hypothetical protein HKX48_003468 [Thoreauomyces humboldtii]|nr:hypothetical protein HKX48_003468 [Thoreauomyces humboldtii]
MLIKYRSGFSVSKSSHGLDLTKELMILEARAEIAEEASLAPEVAQKPYSSRHVLDSAFRDPYRAPNRNNTPATVPLECFDDPEFEIKTPGEWLLLGPSRGTPYTLAYSRYFKYPDSEAVDSPTDTSADWTWLKCDVLSHDSVTDLYTISWHPSGPQKLVKRLNLLFEGESREAFYDRIENAFRTRAAVMEDKRYADAVGEMSGQGVPQLPMAFRKAIIGRIGTFVRRDQPAILATCVKEVEDEFLFAMKRADKEFRDGTAAEALTLLTGKARNWVASALLQSGAGTDDQDGRLFNTVAMATESLSTYMFYANTAVQKALVQVLAALRSVLHSKDAFFRKNHGLPIPFAAFRDRVHANTAWVAAKLSYDWPRKICEILHETLTDSFDFRNGNMAVYKSSRLKMLLHLVDALMATQLAETLLDGLKHAVGIFGVYFTYPAPHLEHPEVCKVHSPLTDHTAVPVLFTLHMMVVAENGEPINLDHTLPDTAACVVLDPSLDEVEATLRNIINLPATHTIRAVPRIEVLAMTALHFPEAEAWISPATHDPSLVEAGIGAVIDVVRTASAAIETLLQTYASRDFLIRTAPSASLWTADVIDIPLLRESLSKYRDAVKTNLALSLPFVYIPPFTVSCTGIQKLYDTATRRALSVFREALQGRLKGTCDELCEAYTILYAQIVADPGQDAQCLHTLQQAVDTCSAQIRYHNSQLDRLKELWQLLYEFELGLEDDVNDLYWTTCAWPVKLEAEIGRAWERMEDSQQQIMSQLDIDREFVLSSLEAYRAEIAHLASAQDINNCIELTPRIIYLRDRLERVKRLCRSIPAREHLIGIPPTPLTLLMSTESAFEPHETLWTLVQSTRTSIAKWLDTYFTDLDGPAVSNAVTKWKMDADRLVVVLTDMRGPSLVIGRMIEEIAEFDRFTGVIASLRNPALKEKHWAEMSKLVGLTLQDVTGLTLRQAMELDLELVQDIIAEISREASNEHEIETTLQALFAELSSESFKVAPYATQDMYTIQNFSDALSVFDDLLIRTAALASKSHSSDGIAVRLDTWVRRLQAGQITLEAWKSFQTVFVRLYPLLALSGEASTLPREQADNFTAVTKIMNILSDIVTRNPRLSLLLLRGDLHEMIAGATGRLDAISEGVVRLVESKRATFPRFYFLTNDQMLDVFAALPAVDAIDPFLVFCFDNLQSLILREEGDVVGELDAESSLRSSAVKVLPGTVRQSVLEKSAARLSTRDNGVIRQPLEGRDSVGGRPSVSSYATETASPLRLSVADKASDKLFARSSVSSSGSPAVDAGSADAVEGFSRPRFQLTSDGSVVIKIVGVRAFDGQELILDDPVTATTALETWLAQLELAIRNTLRRQVVAAVVERKKLVVPTAVKSLSAQVLAVVGQVLWNRYIIARQHDHADAPPRHLIATLQDCIQSLQNANLPPAQRMSIETLIAGLLYTTETARLPYDEIAARFRFTLTDESIDVHVMHHTVPYGFEFASVPRLPSAPEINRAMGQTATLLKYGLCPMVKGDRASSMVQDLADIFGVRCVNLDCSRGWQPGALQRTLSGTFGTGAWLCFKNFDTLPAEILAASAHHISAAVRAFTNAVKTRVSSFSYENQQFLTLKTSAVFASFSALQATPLLPHAVRTLFRPICLSRPDLRALLETSLYARGFSGAPGLARKLAALLQNMANTLALRKYDFNRPEAVARTAAAILQSDRETITETDAVADACEAVYGSQLSLCDRQTFSDAVRVVFDARRAVVPRLIDLFERVTTIARLRHMAVNDYMLAKIGDLYDALCSHTGPVIVIGDVMAGKSTAMELLQAALQDVYIHRIYVSALDEADMVGSLDPITGSLIEGILPLTIREIAGAFDAKNQPIHGTSWIVLDGSLTPSMLELLKPLTDCSTSTFTALGQAIHVPSTTRFVVETDSLESVQPELLTNASIVHMDSRLGALGSLDAMLTVRLKQHLPSIQEHFHIVHAAQTYILHPMLKFATQRLPARSPPTTDTILACHTFDLFAASVKDLTPAGFLRFTTAEQKCWLLTTYAFAVAWVVGCYSAPKERELFSAHLQGLLASDKINAALLRICQVSKEDIAPLGTFKQMQVYDCYFDSRLLVWTPWEKLSAERGELASGYSTDFITTTDVTRTAYFVQLLVPRGHRPMFCGPRGSGKTTCANSAINMRTISACSGKPIHISQAVHADPKSIRARIRAGLTEKRRGALGCLSGKQAVAHLDDLNMSVYRSETANPSLELWRGLLESGGWYGSSSNTSEWIAVEDLAVIATFDSGTASSPGSSSPRFLRHFIALALEADVEKRLNELVLPALTRALHDTIGPAQLASDLVKASARFLATIQNTFRATIPTPHYAFSLTHAVNALRTALHAADKTLSTTVVSIWAHGWHRGVRDSLLRSDLPQYDAAFRDLVDTAFGTLRYSDVFVGDAPIVYVPDRAVSGSRAFWTPLRNPREYAAHLKTKLPEMLGRSNVLHPDAIFAALNLCHAARLDSASIVIGTVDRDVETTVQLAAWILDADFMSLALPPSSDLSDDFVKASRNALHTWKPVLLCARWHNLTTEHHQALLSYIKWGSSDLLLEMLLDDTTVVLLKKRAKLDNTFEDVDTKAAAAIHLRSLVHIVIVADLDSPQRLWTSSQLHFSAYLHACSTLLVNEKSPASIRHLVNHRTPAGQASLPYLDAIGDLFCSVPHTVSTTDMVHTSQLETAIASLCDIYFEKQSALQHDLALLDDSIGRLDAAFVTIKNADLAFLDCKEKFRDSTSRTQEYLKTIEDEREAFDKVKMDLTRDVDLVGKLEEQLSEVLIEVDQGLSVVGPAVLAARNAVERFSKADIYEIKSMLNPSPGTLQLCEALMVLLRVEVKSQESIWDATQRLLFGERLQQLVSALDPTTVTGAQMTRIQECMDNSETRAIHAISRPLGAIADWISSVCEHHATYQILQPRRTAAESLAKRVKEKEKAVEQERQLYAQLEVKLSGMRSSFDAKIKEKEHVAAQYKLAERRNTEMGGLKSTLTFLVRLWSEERIEMQGKRAVLPSEAIMAAWTIAYLGDHDEIARQTIWRQWEGHFQAAGLPIERFANHPFSLCNFLCNEKVEDSFITWGLPPDRFSCDNALIAKWAHKIPLIFDPLDQFCTWMKAAEKLKTYVSLDGLADDVIVEEALAAAMTKGLPLVVKLRIAKMSAVLERFIARSHREADVSQSSDGFRLYIVLLLDHDSQDVPIEWRRTCHSINNEPALSLLTERILDNLLEASGGKNYKEERSRMDFEAMARRSTARSLSRKAKDFVLEMDLSDPTFFNGNLCANILGLEEQLKAVNKIPPATLEIDNAFRTQIEWLREVAISAARIALMVVNAGRVERELIVPLTAIMESARSCLGRLPLNDTATWAIARRNFVTVLLQTLSIKGLASQARVLLGFLIAAELANQEGVENAGYIISEDQLDFLLLRQSTSNPMKNPATTLEVKLPRNPSPQWLEDSRWQRLLSLGARIPLFRRERLVADFVRLANRSGPSSSLEGESFEDVFRSQEPWRCLLPGKWNGLLGPIDRMLLLTCIRPDTLGRWMEDYSAKVLGEAVLEGDPSAVISAWEGGGGSQLLHIDPNGDDPNTLVRALTEKKKVTVTIVFLGGNAADIAAATEAIDQAVEKGRWVLIHAIAAPIAHFTALERALAPRERPAHKNFRVWVTCSSTSQFTPRSTYTSTIYKLVDSDSDVKRSLLMARPLLEANITPFEFKHHAVYRATLLKLLYFHSCLAVRADLAWSDFSVRFDVPSVTLYLAARMLRTLFARSRNERSAIKRVVGVADTIYGPLFPDPSDRRLMLALFDGLVNTDWNMEDPILKALQPAASALMRGDVAAFIGAVREIPATALATSHALCLGPVVFVKRNLAISEDIKASIRRYHRTPQYLSDTKPAITQFVATFMNRIHGVVTGSVLDPAMFDVEVLPMSANASPTAILLASLLLDNIRLYRYAVARFLVLLCSTPDNASFHAQDLSSAITANQIPRAWAELFPPTRMDVGRWTDDLIGRLAYIKHWYAMANAEGEDGGKGLVVHDITKLWAPQALFQYMASTKLSYERLVLFDIFGGDFVKLPS